MTTKDKAVIVIAHRMIVGTIESLQGRIKMFPGELSCAYMANVLDETRQMIETQFGYWLLKPTSVAQAVIGPLEDTTKTRK